MASDRSQWRASRIARVVGWVAAFALCVAAFYDARTLNSGYALPRQGISSVPEAEQVFYLWYALYGSLATLCLVQLLSELEVHRLLARLRDSALERPSAWVGGIALMFFAASLAFRRLILLDQPVTDDEGTYVFIARTLLAGRVSNPLPQDADFFRNQFVVLNEHGWHGKYPIGHPLLLAAGEALGAIDLIMPLVGALCVVATYRVGRKLFDERVAAVGATLLLLSPHFVWTCATLLSQPTLCLTMLAGMLALLQLADDRRLRWAALAGCAAGFGILVRPLPGALFALVGGVFCAVDARNRGEPLRAVAAKVGLFALGALPWLAVFLAVNHAQSGSMFTSGYQEYHPDMRLLWNDRGQVSNSLGGALIRENFWLLGWTFALLAMPFCRPMRARALFWAMLLAELAYRVIAPKTVVSVTGPVYLTEVVPLLTLAVADAVLRIGRHFHTSRVRPSVVVLAASITAVSMFTPLQIGALLSGADARLVVHGELEKAQASRALIFANALVRPLSTLSWAYFPDNPSPNLDDDWLFVRIPPGEAPHARMFDFWQRRYPDRRAFIFIAGKDGTKFAELTAQ